MKHISNKRKNIVFSMLLICSMLLLCGCSSDPKNFSEAGITITLTNAFKVEKNDNFDVYIASEDVVFSAVQETSTQLELSGYEISSLNDYCQEILTLNDTPKDKLQKRNNYYYFTNSKTVSGAKYTYVHCMFSDADSYWICEFVCKSKSYDKLEDKLLSWADTIVFTH